MKMLKATLREITKELKLDIKAFDVPYERIEHSLIDSSRKIMFF